MSQLHLMCWISAKEPLYFQKGDPYVREHKSERLNETWVAATHAGFVGHFPQKSPIISGSFAYICILWVFATLYDKPYIVIQGGEDS